jgi:hypothetical protein
VATRAVRVPFRDRAGSSRAGAGVTVRCLVAPGASSQPKRSRPSRVPGIVGRGPRRRCPGRSRAAGRSATLAGAARPQGRPAREGPDDLRVRPSTGPPAAGPSAASAGAAVLRAACCGPSATSAAPVSTGAGRHASPSVREIRLVTSASSRTPTPEPVVTPARVSVLGSGCPRNAPGRPALAQSRRLAAGCRPPGQPGQPAPGSPGPGSPGRPASLDPWRHGRRACRAARRAVFVRASPRPGRRLPGAGTQCECRHEFSVRLTLRARSFLVITSWPPPVSAWSRPAVDRSGQRLQLVASMAVHPPYGSASTACRPRPGRHRGACHRLRRRRGDGSVLGDHGPWPPDPTCGGRTAAKRR